MTTATQNRTEQKTTEGERVATVGRDGARMAKTGSGFSDPIWTGKIYEARRRQYDGTLTWRLVDTFGGDRSGRRPSQRFCVELQSATDLDFYGYGDGIRHGAVCK